MTKQFTVRLEPEVIDSFNTVAEAAHLKGTAYAAAVIGKLSQLRPEFALHAISSIPQEYFKRGPGRPPSGPIGSDGNNGHST